MEISKEVRNAYVRKYYAKHIEERRAYQNRYRAENREKAREWGRASYARHKEEISERNKNKPKTEAQKLWMREYMRWWRFHNKSRVKKYNLAYRQRKKNGIEQDI